MTIGMRASLPSVLVALTLLFFFSCDSKRGDYADIPTDPESIAKGELFFSQNCSACHSFRQDGIGPRLGGITRMVSADWITSFIRDPKSVVESGDERGTKLLARYKTLMPSFGHLSEEELAEIVAYLHTQEAPAQETSALDTAALADPIPAGVTPSELIAGAELVTQIPFSANKGMKTRITKLDYIPKTERLFIVDIRGKLYELTAKEPRVYMDMAELRPKFIDAPGLATGFGSFAFHPDFVNNGLLYTGHTEPAGTAKADFHYADSIPVALQWVITEWTAEEPQAFPFKGTGRELFRIDMVTGMHGVQEITFNPNATPEDEDYGLLYIGIGDGACVQSGYPFLVQSIKMPWGSIFRIDPRGNNSTNKQYGIPASNPFADRAEEGARGEIYAYGFRNPHRITWTRDGRMLASNVGQAMIESINLIQAGHNYGWAIREGTFLVNPFGDINKVYPLPEDDEKFNITYPAAQYDHDEGLAVTGGFEYTGATVPELKGKYLFGDMNNGRLYYVDLSEVKPGELATIREWRVMHQGRLTTTTELCGSTRVDLRFGKDQHGEVYFFSKQDGKVYRLAQPRRHLSQR